MVETLGPVDTGVSLHNIVEQQIQLFEFDWPGGLIVKLGYIQLYLAVYTMCKKSTVSAEEGFPKDGCKVSAFPEAGNLDCFDSPKEGIMESLS